MSRIDLHTHTTWSDGSYSPTELVKWAHQHDIQTLAITDHDTTEGIDEALAISQTLRMDLIPGIEISTRFREREIHVLGYFINYQDASFQTRIRNLQSTRLQRIQEILHKLTLNGITLYLEDVQRLAGSGSIGRPHIAQLLIQQAYVSTFREAFERYLGVRGKAYVPRDVPEASDIFSWIREAGGLAILAHPFWEGFRQEDVDPACRTLAENGLQGLEVFYGTFSAKQISFNLHLAKRFNLLVSGGSDFHGTFKPEIAIGKGKGSLKVPQTALDNLRKAAGQ
ncbi:MAG: PHP domain-containing protein [Nitrospirales bacterium]